MLPLLTKPEKYLGSRARYLYRFALWLRCAAMTEIYLYCKKTSLKMEFVRK
jgi:hypothetical protein